VNPLSHQTVLVAVAGVDIPFFPGENQVIGVVVPWMRWTHALLIHLVTFATSHVLLYDPGDQQDQRFLGLVFCNDRFESFLPFEKHGGLINTVIVCPVVTTRKYIENAQ